MKSKKDVLRAMRAAALKLPHPRQLEGHEVETIKKMGLSLMLARIAAKKYNIDLMTVTGLASGIVVPPVWTRAPTKAMQAAATAAATRRILADDYDPLAPLAEAVGTPKVVKLRQLVDEMAERLKEVSLLLGDLEDGE